MNRLVAMDAWHKTGSAWSNITKLTDFQERISYDANGNILGYKRNGNNSFASKPLGMDSLTYKYVMGTNRLDHVKDSVSAANYDVDIDNQTAGNYVYDSIGNLIKDNAEGITSISWTVYGKISRIIKTDGTNISYTYDAGGNRISKAIVKTSPASADTTWYVWDAQGNVMSVYASGNDSVNDGHLTQTELHMYGSSRVGLLRRGVDVAIDYHPADTSMPLLGTGYSLTFGRGNKLFELSNRLGNVLVTLNDKKLGVSSNNNTVDYFNPQMALSLMSLVPDADFVTKPLKFAGKYADEDATLVKQSGIIPGKREIMTVTKTGLRTDAYKVASAAIGDLGDDAIPLMGKSTSKYPDANKIVVGMQSADGSRGWRIDFDPEKGAHYNWFNNNTGERGAVFFEGTADQVHYLKQQMTKTY
ncbi:hypothetical protein FAM09_12915 [Niastella caeni]|uniref:RHS repeat-associated core domain-containing protein n=1 Tax=Niastella caeni TaxID=2569763 RepID=A0A4S8HW28_9BACT|nr:hypothetical protein [Niastella caeni]THU39401.1 hypothetical protein FAM09_12915 [Niastella caeni]